MRYSFFSSFIDDTLITKVGCVKDSLMYSCIVQAKYLIGTFRCNTRKAVSIRCTPTKIVLLKNRLYELGAVLKTYFLFFVSYLIFTTMSHLSMAFYCTKHDSKMNIPPMRHL